MAAITGKQSLLGFKKATTYGTAVAADKLFGVYNFNQSNNNVKLEQNLIGLNKIFQTDMSIGDRDPRLSWSGAIGAMNNFPYFLALFFGTAAAPVEQTGAQNDWMHRLTFSSTLNPQYATFAQLSSSATTFEWAAVAIDTLTLHYALDYLKADFTALADIRNLSSATNTSASLGALTAPATDDLVIEQSDYFAINAQAGGALSSSDKLTNVKSVTVSYAKPQSSPRYIKGSAGNGEPLSDANYSCMVSIELGNMADHTWYTAAAAGTEYKAQIAVEGAQIGTGVNRGLTTFFPRLKLIQDPTYDLGSLGHNPHVLNFEAITATANPTGMNSTLPYAQVINTVSTNLLA